MVPAIDGALTHRRRRTLERHVAGCGSCRAELTTTRGVLAAVTGLPAEGAVPPRLEQATLRAVRLAAAAEEEARGRAWWRTPALAGLAVAAALAAVAVGVRRYADGPAGPAGAPLEVARPVEQRPATAPTPAPSPPARTVVARRPAPPAEPPKQPPPELAARPELFVELPILRHMEKLDHLEAIQATALDGAPIPGAGERERSSG
jgi:hypothetical protein